MVQPMTMLRVIDNSGATLVRCIQVLRGPRTMGTTGHIIVCSVRRTDSSAARKVNKGEVHRALIVRAKNERARRDGSWLRPGQAACVLVQPNGTPIGNRIRGAVSQDLLRHRQHLKIVSLATSVL